MTRLQSMLIAIFAMSFVLGCDPGEETSCTPLDTPSFANVHALVLAPSCAVGGSCHTNDAAAGELGLSDLASAHVNLVQEGRVIPGDPEGSPLMERLESPVSHSQHMPPGVTLSEPERCMVATWIERGAQP